MNVLEPEITVNEDGTKHEEPPKLNRHQRRARMSVLKRLIRKAKKEKKKNATG